MTVAAAINGQIASEGAALYAMQYAQTLDRTLELLHVKNDQDALEEVETSMENIERAAAERGVEVRRFILEGEPVRAVGNHLLEGRAEILFCGARVRKNLRKDSFSRRLLAGCSDCDIAVAHTPHAGAVLAVEHALLPIREDRLSPMKFAFFATLLRGCGAAGEIYSVTRLRTRRRSELETCQVRERLEQINRRLSHYTRLAALAGFSLHVKHAFASDRTAQILHHLHHYGYQLLVLGGRRPSFPFLKWDRTERLLQVTPINTILFYTGQER